MSKSKPNLSTRIQFNQFSPNHLNLQLIQQAAASSVVTSKLAASTSTHKIQSKIRRATQIAHHFSSSSTPSSNINNDSSPDPTTPSLATNMASKYTTRKIAAPNTLEHRIYIEKDGVPVSPFHDIPLYANEQQTILNMVVEIPRWTNGKLEVCVHFVVDSFDPSTLTPQYDC